MTQLITNAIEAVQERLSLQGQINAARRSLEHHLDDALVKIEQQIPRYILQNAQGIIFLSEVSASYGYGASIGTGIVMGRLNTDSSKWSGPISIYSGSINYGLQYGAAKVDHIIILKNHDVVADFMEKGSLKVGIDASVAVGPLGRDVQLGIDFNWDHLSPILSYSVDTKGLYIGVNLEGSMINIRNDCNESFYNASNISARDILDGKITPPADNEDFNRIVELLQKYCNPDNVEAQKEIQQAKQEIGQQLDSIKENIQEKTDQVLNILSSDEQDIKNLQQKGEEKVNAVIEKGKELKDQVIEINNNVQENIKSAVDNVTENIKEKVDNVKEVISSAVSPAEASLAETSSSQQKEEQKIDNKLIEIVQEKLEETSKEEMLTEVIETIQAIKIKEEHQDPEEEKRKIAEAKEKLRIYMDQ